MENSCLFIRGQVWYWEDPIFGRKENNLDISIGEATLRYSRYCIIAQTTKTIDKSSVLVIPCSSSNHTPHDVPSPLVHVFHDNFTYARTRGIFPVHPKLLQRYICTLSESTMKQIEAELIKLLIPSLTEALSNQDILDFIGVNMELSELKTVPEKYIPNLEVNLRSFIRNHLVKSDPKDILSAYELKDAFNQYCAVNSIEIVDDIVEFLDAFVKVTNNSGYHFSDKMKYNLIEFHGLRLKGNLKLSIDMENMDLINPNDPQRPGKWDDDSIREFLTLYNSDGIEAASEKFDLKPSTATNYWYKWKDRYELNVTPKLIPAIPSTADAPKAVSKLSNMIRDTLKEKEAFDLQNDYMISPDNMINETSFYNILGTCIYYSLLDFLSIRKDESGSFFNPNLNSNSKYLKSWHLLDHLYHDRRISMTKNGVEMISAYRKIFIENDGIDIEWLDKLHVRLTNKLNLNHSGITQLCYTIKRIYCERWLKSN